MYVWQLLKFDQQPKKLFWITCPGACTNTNCVTLCPYVQISNVNCFCFSITYVNSITTSECYLQSLYLIYNVSHYSMLHTNPPLKKKARPKTRKLMILRWLGPRTDKNRTVENTWTKASSIYFHQRKCNWSEHSMW